jgi:hypothetical protein
VTLAKFDNTVGHNQLLCVGLVLDFGRLIKEIQKALGVDKILVDRAVDVREAVQWVVELESSQYLK